MLPKELKGGIGDIGLVLGVFWGGILLKVWPEQGPW